MNASDAPVAESIEFYRSYSQLMNDAVDRLLIAVHSYKKNFDKKIILLTGCSALSGTTTIAINLAIALSSAGWKTLLVDADLKKGSAYKRLGKKVQTGLSNYLEGRSSIDTVIYPTNCQGLSYVPCGVSDANPIRLLCSEKMADFIETKKAEYEFIIFDSPSITVAPDATVLFPSVDGIALVASMNVTTKKQLASSKHEVATCPDKYYGLIINCVDKIQYGKLIPQHDYFEPPQMAKRHKKWLKKTKRPKS